MENGSAGSGCTSQHQVFASDAQRYRMTDTGGQGPTGSAVLSALERTGFLLEQQRVTQKLESAGFQVIVNGLPRTHLFHLRTPT
jgi:peptidoglycan hydrolase-like protein with peptidoglycan-binding domain